MRNFVVRTLVVLFTITVLNAQLCTAMPALKKHMENAKQALGKGADEFRAFATTLAPVKPLQVYGKFDETKKGADSLSLRDALDSLMAKYETVYDNSNDATKASLSASMGTFLDKIGASAKMMGAIKGPKTAARLKTGPLAAAQARDTKISKAKKPSGDDADLVQAKKDYAVAHKALADYIALNGTWAGVLAADKETIVNWANNELRGTDDYINNPDNKISVGTEWLKQKLVEAKQQVAHAKDAAAANVASPAEYNSALSDLNDYLKNTNPDFADVDPDDVTDALGILQGKIRAEIVKAQAAIAGLARTADKKAADEALYADGTTILTNALATAKVNALALPKKPKKVKITDDPNVIEALEFDFGDGNDEVVVFTIQDDQIEFADPDYKDKVTDAKKAKLIAAINSSGYSDKAKEDAKKLLD